MERLKILGERLYLLRKGKRLRQADIAELIGVTQAHYQRIEKGKINISVLMLCTLSDFFDVSVDYLLGRTDECV